MNYVYKSILDYTSHDYELFKQKLTDNDKQKVLHLLMDINRKQYILGRILLKRFLSNTYSIDYNTVTIKYNHFGKPYLDNINFNISHSHDYVILATSNKKIGVDIEKIRNVKLSTMNTFCTANEINYINNSSNKYLAFWLVYTLKESYFKMLGTNLFDMKKVEFNILDDKIICLNNPNLKIFISTEIKDYIFSIIYL